MSIVGSYTCKFIESGTRPVQLKPKVCATLRAWRRFEGSNTEECEAIDWECKVLQCCLDYRQLACVSLAYGWCRLPLDLSSLLSEWILEVANQTNNRCFQTLVPVKLFVLAFFTKVSLLFAASSTLLLIVTAAHQSLTAYNQLRQLIQVILFA